ncbi:MAG: helix-turn-helix transcriptional regulator [Burkholderiales bacterium]|jgi:DNA-binding CsgD family transcriptional regulator|nr:helix-turn-helix transcriptional regulator [Burkholderiales bacterium]MBP6544392.1 helix-turn-helix transcriptional regulator [Piscinibacter sp.]
MELRSLRLDPGIRLPRSEATGALAGLIGCIGDEAFGQRGIEQLARLLPLGWWTVYRIFDDAPPALHFGGCLQPEDCVAEAFGAYRAGLWRHDRALDGVREHVARGDAVLTHLHALELAPEHRRRIFQRHGLSERLSLACEDADGALLAMNLYRHESQPAFSDEERDTLQALGSLLLTCVVRHLALRPQGPAPILEFETLTRREREVCERLLRGWTHDGIAADLQLSPTTVKTYRDRAFERLGIHQRHELFALALKR